MKCFALGFLFLFLTFSIDAAKTANHLSLNKNALISSLNIASFKRSVTIPSCRSHRNCIQSCSCELLSPTDTDGVCIDIPYLDDSLQMCTKCYGNSGCSFDDSCEIPKDSLSGYCMSCVQDALIDSIQTCIPLDGGQTTSATSDSGLYPDESVGQSSDLQGQTSSSASQQTQNPGISPPTGQQTSPAQQPFQQEQVPNQQMPQAQPQNPIPQERDTLSTDESTESSCISTAWIESNGLSSGIMKRGPISYALCIPDFPCGTPGHAIRECNRGNSECRLKTYRDVCEQRGDCVDTYLAVSELMSSFDWSIVSRSACDLTGNLYLTSVSMNENASDYSFSRIIASIADMLIESGWGSAVQEIRKWFQAISRMIIFAHDINHVNTRN